MMKKVALLLLVPYIFAQCVTHDAVNTTQLGFGAKIHVDFSGDKNTNYQISVTGGAAQSVLSNSVLLFYQPSLILYQGGLGSKSTFKSINKYRFEIVNTLGTTIRYYNPVFTEGDYKYATLSRNLITWSAGNATALKNPYQYGLTISSNFIWSNAKNADGSLQVQRVGFSSISAPYLTLGYANDGPPFDGWRALGDAYDRYWTGRGFAQFDFDFERDSYLATDYAKWQLTIEYDRFTGFLRDNYEAANVLGLRFVPYGTESAWNKGRWKIGVMNRNYNVGVTASFYNYNRWDFQNLIHIAQRYPFHGNTYNKAWGIGFQYDYSK